MSALSSLLPPICFPYILSTASIRFRIINNKYEQEVSLAMLSPRNNSESNDRALKQAACTCLLFPAFSTDFPRIQGAQHNILSLSRPICFLHISPIYKILRQIYAVITPLKTPFTQTVITSLQSDKNDFILGSYAM